MKIFSIILCLIVFFNISCKHDEDKCNYNLYTHPTDSSFFVSYSIEGKNFKYYQARSFLVSMGGQIINENSSDTVNYWGYYYTFEEFEQSGSVGPKVLFIIWSKELENHHQHIPTNLIFNSENAYVCPNEDFQINDTAYINGVSLSIDVGYFSTSNLMQFYNYNYDTIYNHILIDSYFDVFNKEPLCNFYYLIEGEFETVLVSTPEHGKEQSFVNVKNGKFRLLTQY